MKSIEFKINKKIELICKDSSMGVSLIQDVGKDYILVSIPMNGFKKVMLYKGDCIEALYYDNENLYSFQSTILGRVTEKGLPFYQLKMPDSLEKAQRRNFVRTPVSLPFLYIEETPKLDAMLKNTELKEVEKNFECLWKKGNTLDLSGGGMKAHFKESLEVGKRIFVLFQSKNLNIGVKGEVIRCTSCIREKQVSYHLGINFVDIPEIQQEKIIGFVFNRLRELRKKDVRV